MYKFLNQIQLRFISCFEHFVVIGLDAAGSFYCFDAINKTVPYSNDPKLNEWTNEWTTEWMNEWMNENILKKHVKWLTDLLSC